jgi:hypothetical protein
MVMSTMVGGPTNYFVTHNFSGGFYEKFQNMTESGNWKPETEHAALYV